MTGSFKTKSVKWYSGHTNRYGYVLVKMITQLGLVSVYVSSTSTKFHQESGIDVTFALESLSRRIEGVVLRKELGSDHRYIPITSRIECCCSKKVGKMDS